MIADLGKYAVEVMSAYVVSIALLVAIVALFMRRAKKMRVNLAQVETRVKARKERSNGE